MAMRTVLGAFKQADIDYRLIEDDDRIAIGVSGGKDSVCLLYAMKLYQKFSQKNFTIVAINIIMGFPNMDFQPLIDFCNKENIEFHQIPSRPMIYEVLKLNLDNSGKFPCSICSRMKKAAMVQAARQFTCNKVAFAHHGDDAIETLFMNMIHGAKIATFVPKMYLSREKTTFIRPFVYAREKDIQHTVKQLSLPVIESTCLNNKKTEREQIKQRLKALYIEYPESRNNFLKMLHNLDKLELWEKEKLD